ncbi:MAG: hypothetical protein LAP21_14695 [Acidobacteriia bacterium]|nr:hypothetical protein [Terriglobia bacterium]
MKRITLRADETLIEQARLAARAQNTTLEAAFREWLIEFTAQATRGREFDTLMRSLKHVRTGRDFHRDEMNER